jgi:hypothetical protein
MAKVFGIVVRLKLGNLCDWNCYSLQVFDESFGLPADELQLVIYSVGLSLGFVKWEQQNQ